MNVEPSCVVDILTLKAFININQLYKQKQYRKANINNFKIFYLKTRFASSNNISSFWYLKIVYYL